MIVKTWVDVIKVFDMKLDWKNHAQAKELVKDAQRMFSKLHFMYVDEESKRPGSNLSTEMAIARSKMDLEMKFLNAMLKELEVSTRRHEDEATYQYLYHIKEGHVRVEDILDRFSETLNAKNPMDV